MIDHVTIERAYGRAMSITAQREGHRPRAPRFTADKKLPTHQEAVFNAIKGSMMVREIASASGLTKEQARGAIKYLVSRGLVVRVGKEAAENIFERSAQ